MKQRSLEEVKALSEEEAVEIMRQAGILGAGGGGFPTYFKYKNLQPHLIVNANESEPGYWADKVMHKEYLDEYLKVYEALKAIFGFEQVTMCIHERGRSRGRGRGVTVTFRQPARSKEKPADALLQAKDTVRGG